MHALPAIFIDFLCFCAEFIILDKKMLIVFLPSDLIMNKQIDKVPTLKYIHVYSIKCVYKLCEIIGCSVDIFHIPYCFCLYIYFV